MKSSFSGYYIPTEQEFNHIWENCLFVLDTNVILNLYRYPNVAREEFFGVLERIQDRLWVPHQVGLEYQRRRLTVIAGERKKMDESLSGVTKAIDSIKEQINLLELAKRGLDVSTDDITEFLNSADKKLIEVVKKVHEAQLDISTTDPIREKIDSLLSGRVGPCPSNQDEVNELISEGDLRYANKVPPGFKDLDKDKDPNNSSYYFDGLKFTAKFGDLILWRQLINHAKKNELKKILFITSDRKEDWWWIEKGRTLGPQPELVREIIRIANVEQFWMYSAEQFIQNANKYLKTNVSEQTLREVENTSLSDSEFFSDSVNLDSENNVDDNKYLCSRSSDLNVAEMGDILTAIKNIHSEKARVTGADGNCFVIDDGGCPHLYYIKNYLSPISDLSFSRSSDIFNSTSLVDMWFLSSDLSYNVILNIKFYIKIDLNYLIGFIGGAVDREFNRLNGKLRSVIAGYFVEDEFKILKVFKNLKNN